MNETCGKCEHFNASRRNKNIGQCVAPIPYYGKLVEIYDYVAVDDVIASMCDCYKEAQDDGSGNVSADCCE